jgi:hypothetical protein
MSGRSTTGPILHVAALPFPSPQGTQAAIASMLEALASAGRDVHLLCYPHAGSEQTFSRAFVRCAPGPARANWSLI